jgi:hypothetical protein
MPRILLLLILTFLSTYARAEWAYVAELMDNGTPFGTGFYEPGSVSKKGNLVQVKILVNYDPPTRWTSKKTGQKMSQSSSIDVLEFDCEDPKFRGLWSEGYPGKDGKGKMIFRTNTPEDKWQAVSVTSYANPTPPLKLWGIVCGVIKP